MKKWGKRVAITLLSILGAVLAILLICQLILSPKVCTSLVNKYYPKLIDGKLEMREASVSLFSHFPAIALTIDSLSLSYGEKPDTLASFHRFRASINVLPLLKGEINVKEIRLSHPRAFILRDADGWDNYKIIKVIGADTTAVDDTSKSELPKIVLRRLSLDSKPFIVYRSIPDSLSLMLRLKSMDFRGRLDVSRFQRSKFRFEVDSLMAGGRLARDTILFGLDYLWVKADKGNMDVEADAKAFAATKSFGRVAVPLHMEGGARLALEDDRIDAGVYDFGLDVATVHIDADMDASIADDIALKGSVRMPGLDVQVLLDEYVRGFWADAQKIKTDAVASLKVDVDGVLGGPKGSIPAFNAAVSLPRCSISHSDYPVTADVKLRADASAPQDGRIDVRVDTLLLSAPGLSLDANAGMKDLMGDDPLIDLNAKLKAGLDAVEGYLGDVVQMNMSGKLNADASLTSRLSNLNVYHLGDIKMKANVLAENVVVSSYDDSLNLFVDSLRINVKKMEDRFAAKRGEKKELLGALVKIDSLHFLSEGTAQANVNGMSLLAQTSAEKVKITDSLTLNPIRAMLSMKKVSFIGPDSLRVRLRDSKSTFRIAPSRQDVRIPVISVTSKNGRVSARSGPHGAFLRNLNLRAKATRASQQQRVAKSAMPRRNMPASIAGKGRFSGMRAPSWMQESDFRKSDLKLNLDESTKNYYKDWDVNGNLSLERARVSTPAFPIPTKLTGFGGTFDNDKVSLDSLTLISGRSELDAHGTVSNLRSVVARNGMLRLNLKVNSDSLDVSQMLDAYYLGQQNMAGDLSKISEMSDDQQEKMYSNTAQVDSLGIEDRTPLIVVPANVDANINIQGRNIKFSTMNVGDFYVDLLMKRRCAKISGLKMLSNVGDVYADAFYSSTSKKDISAGFDLNLKKVSAGQVINLIPQMDTILPLIKSFDGLMNCNISATTQLDTNMNIVLPSLDGVIRITGSDLHFQDNKTIAAIGRMLLFRNPRRATIDTMTVEGVIKDNTLEVFPFLLKMDRWTLALAGVQNMNDSFNYHVSMVKTPLLFKLGANMTGPDFDNYKLKLGKAKYRKVESIPSFGPVIDSTRVNLVESIKNVFDKGVEAVIRDNKKSHSRFDARRSSEHYTHSVALDSLETLSKREMRQLDSLKTVPDTTLVNGAGQQNQ